MACSATAACAASTSESRPAAGELTLRTMSSLLVALLSAASLAACARSVEPTGLTGFARAAGDISKQADLSFIESNRLARNVSVDRFVRSGEVGLTEDKFLTAVRPEDITAWQEALGDLEEYGTALASLVDTKRGGETSDALVDLGRQLRDGRTSVEINPGVASAFASLGGALVNLRAQRRARDVLVATDPHVQELLRGMADALGGSDREGLRGTVHTNYLTSFSGVQRAYAAAATERNEARQRALVAEFLAATDRRDAQLRSLAALRSSLLALAAAHSAAAAGAPATVEGLLGSIEARLDETKRLYDAFQKPAEKENAG